MFRALYNDALQLASTATGKVTARSIAQVVLVSDSYRITSIHRLRETLRKLHIPLVSHLLRVLQTTMFAIEIDPKVSLGEGVYFVHSLGVIIGGNSRIGARVRFYGNNTVGTVRDDGYPVIEDDVWIGAGARILGPIRIGARSRVGANAVVLRDVPPDSVAVGIPATIHPRKDLPGASTQRILEAAAGADTADG
jgi:serine O-acetyltransferase